MPNVLCSNGDLVMFDCDAWERNDANIYELGGPIQKLCWLNQTTCLVNPKHSLYIYSYSSRGGMASRETKSGSIGILQGKETQRV